MLRTTTLRKGLLIGLLTFLIMSQAGTVSAGTNVWTSIGFEGGRITALAIDPTAPTTLYVGTYDGVFKSTNGGAAWSVVNTGDVRALAIDPAAPSTLYVGTVFDGGGVIKSTNGGAAWDTVNSGLTNINVEALAIDPVTPSTLYAGTWGGVFKSTNGGAAWSLVYTGDVTAIAIDSATPTTLYVATYSGVFKSTNSGMAWSAVNIGLTNHHDVAVLTIDPVTTSTLYAGTGGGVFKSTNGGGNWSAVNIGLTSTGVRALVIDPTTPSTLYAGTGGGVFKSTNGGVAWSAFNTGLTSSTNVYALAIDSATPSTLYAGIGGGNVFAILQIPVLLATNYSSGAPGSYFTITGSNFPPSGTATIVINGNILGTVPTNSSGGLIFSLKTSPTAGEGLYRVTASVPPSASTQFTLDAEDDVHSQEGSETVFIVPDGIAYQVVYLPLIVK
jgi:photosystem II stability/assembly factor-like uncharacterized protein